MKKLFALVSMFVFVAMIGLTTMGTTYTKTFSRVTISNYGPVLQATHTFSGALGSAAASQDTAYFPFTTTPIAPGSIDTVIAVVGVECAPAAVNATGDSISVAWQYQYSFDNLSWSTPVTLGIDTSAVTTAIVGATYYTQRYFVIGTKTLGKQIWPSPYWRIVAYGRNTSGGIKQSPSGVIRVTVLR